MKDTYSPSIDLQFDDLPQEIQLQILLYLNSSDLTRDKCVSKAWYKLCNTELLWKILLQKDFPGWKLKNTQASYQNNYILAENYIYRKKQYTLPKPFLSHEKALFISVKNDDLINFNTLLEEYYPTFKSFVKLFKILDWNDFSIFHWLGKLNRHTLKNHLFSKILAAWEKEHSKKSLNIIKLAAACNQLSFFKDSNDVLERSKKYLQIANYDNPLMIACQFNSYDVAVFLIEQSIEAKNIQNKKSGNCISFAAPCGDEKLLNYLIGLGLDINHIDHLHHQSNTPLMFAIAKENTHAVRLLLEKGADPNIFSKKLNGNAFTVAFQQQSNAIMHLLLDKTEVETAYLLQAYSSQQNIDQEILNKLFKHACKKFYKENKLVQESDNCNNTIVHWHAFCNIAKGLEACPKKLLNQKNIFGVTPLFVAAQFNNVTLTRALIEAGAENNIQCVGKKTPFFLAVERNCTEMVDYYLTLPDTDLNLRNDERSTPLRIACEDGQLEIVVKLLNSLADINSATNINNTPLITAAKRGYFEIVIELLLRPDINTLIRHANGDTAFSYAKNNGHTSCAALIELMDNFPEDALWLSEDNHDIQETIVRFLFQNSNKLNFFNFKNNVAETINRVGIMRLDRIKTESERVTQELIHNLQTTHYELNELIPLLRDAFDNLVKQKCFDHNLKAIGLAIRALNRMKFNLEMKSLPDEIPACLLM